jgi:hypothetical protein
MSDSTTDSADEPTRQGPLPALGNHASDETLVALAEGFLLQQRIDELRAHILTCPICRQRAAVALHADESAQFDWELLAWQESNLLPDLIRQRLKRIPTDELKTAARRRAALIQIQNDLVGTVELPQDQQLAFLLALANGVELLEQETAVAQLTDRHREVAMPLLPREALDQVAAREDPLSIGYRLIHYAAVLPEVVAKLLGRSTRDVQSDYEYVQMAIGASS